MQQDYKYYAYHRGTDKGYESLSDLNQAKPIKLKEICINEELLNPE